MSPPLCLVSSNCACVRQLAPTLCRELVTLPCLPLQHYVGTTWRFDEDEDAPVPAPTLRAMPLRPRAMPSAILAGTSPCLGGTPIH